MTIPQDETDSGYAEMQAKIDAAHVPQAEIDEAYAELQAASKAAHDPMADRPSPSDLERLDKARQRYWSLAGKETRRRFNMLEASKNSGPAPTVARPTGRMAGKMSDVLARMDAQFAAQQRGRP